MFGIILIERQVDYYLSRRNSIVFEREKEREREANLSFNNQS